MGAAKKPAAKKPAAGPKPPKPTIYRGHEAEVDALALTLDGALAVSVDWRESAVVTELATGAQRRLEELLPGRLTGVATLCDGRMVAAGWANTFVLFDPREPEPERTWASRTGRIAWQLCASPVAPRFAAVLGDARDNNVHGYEVEGATVREVLVLERAATARFLADGTLVCVRNTALEGPEARHNPGPLGAFTAQPAWRLEGYDASGARRFSLERVGGVLAAHPRAPVLALAEQTHDALGVVRVPEGDGPCVAGASSPGGPRVSLDPTACFSPDGGYVFAAAHDALLVYSSDGLRRGRVERAHTKALRALAATPDGRHLVTGGWDKTVRVWDLPALCALAR